MSLDQTTYQSVSAEERAMRHARSPDVAWLVLALGALLPPALLAVSLPLIVRVPLGLAVALFAPGYALMRALFHHAEFDLPARIGLNFGLSVAALPLLAMVLDLLPWGIRPWPMALSLSVWIVLCTLVRLVRQRLQGGEALAADRPSVVVRDWWGICDRRGWVIAMLTALMFIGILAASYLAITAPAPTSKITEFYVLGSEGLAEDYPRVAAPGETMQIQLGITNREGASASYGIEVRTAGQLLKQVGPISLNDGETWSAPLRYALDQTGDDQQVDILLFRDGERAPYRTLRLWVNIQPHSP